MDSVPMFERWKWTMSDVEALDFDEFCLLADVVKELNKRDMAANSKGK